MSHIPNYYKPGSCFSIRVKEDDIAISVVIRAFTPFKLHNELGPSRPHGKPTAYQHTYPRHPSLF